MTAAATSRTATRTAYGLLTITALCWGALGFTAFNALFYVSAHSTTALNMGIVQGPLPVFVILGAFVVYGTGVLVLGGIWIAERAATSRHP